jgi:phosphohistidine phosphatase
MRHLTLVRHAQAVPPDSCPTDFDRPLAPSGLAAAQLMSRRVAAELPHPQLLVSSSAMRALTTARQFASVLRQQDVRLEPRIYEATPGTLLELVAQLPDAVEHAMLFGHNPGFSQLSQLLSGESGELPTCAVAHLELDIPSWAKVAPGCGRLLQLCAP